ncbi:hypothetical protein [Rufibacter roseus]|uniref:Uncharacterized protein n=1 Tax=Rufibacter roseus TaxID=1567108 RepID=A0ABW2DPA6_9BACT|nr:hypothetical protein [Rufibacter roseus]
MKKGVTHILFLGLASMWVTCFGQSTKTDISTVPNSHCIYGSVPSCYFLTPDAFIKPYRTKASYVGRIVFKAEIDTTSLLLHNYTILFAKLYSRNNPQDSIEIRLNDKVGNFSYVEELKPKLIKHLRYIRLRKVDTNNCVTPSSFTIPLQME